MRSVMIFLCLLKSCFTFTGLYHHVVLFFVPRVRFVFSYGCPYISLSWLANRTNRHIGFSNLPVAFQIEIVQCDAGWKQSRSAESNGWGHPFTKFPGEWQSYWHEYSFQFLSAKFTCTGQECMERLIKPLSLLNYQKLYLTLTTFVSWSISCRINNFLLSNFKIYR